MRHFDQWPSAIFLAKPELHYSRDSVVFNRKINVCIPLLKLN